MDNVLSWLRSFGCLIDGFLVSVEERVETLGRILGQADTKVQELTKALQAHQAETVRLQAKVRNAATAGAQAGGRCNVSPSRGGVDTRMLGKLGVFHGEEAR